MGSSVFSYIALVLFFISVSVYVSSVLVTEIQLDQSWEGKSNKELLLLLGNRHGRRVLAVEEEVVKKKKVVKILDAPISDLEQRKKQSKPTNSSSSSSPIPKNQPKKNTTSSNSSDPVKSSPVSSDKPKKFDMKLSDLPRSSNPKNKTTEATKVGSTEATKVGSVKITQKTEEKKKDPKPETKKIATANAKPKSPILDIEEPDDLIEEFRDLPSKFQESLLPDLEHISKTSRAYLSRANQEITDGFKPLIGSRYAPFVASVTSYIFLLLPLLLVSLLFSHIKSYFSLTKILLFIQIYLATYFAILSLAFVFTGVEPLRFFYTSSRSSYVYMQILQMLGYVIYLLLQLLHLVVMFSTQGGLGEKVYGLVGSAVSSVVVLHYYSAVFHRALLQKPPRTNWKVHGVYSVSFVVVCLFAKRGKKAYLLGGDDDKKN